MTSQERGKCVGVVKDSDLYSLLVLQVKMAQVPMEEDLEELFIDDLPDYLRCSICLCCLKNPYQTPCGHRFCRECIMPVIQSPNNVCPQDRTHIDTNNTYPDNAVKLQINSLKIKCPKYKEGCTWVGELSDKQNHQQKCKYVSVPCELCGKAILKAYMEAHLDLCPMRSVACEYCKADVPYSEKAKHYQVCPDYPLPCQYSCRKEPFLRKNLQSHYASCPRVPVPCSMAPFGCTLQVERGRLGEHVKECGPKHTAEMAAAIMKLQTQMEELKSKVAAQEEVIQGMENTVYPSAGQFTWRVDNIRDKIKLAQNGDPTASVIYSPPFYSSEAGYKFCLCIYPAGDNNQGYLSLYFVVMKGQFDEVLPWPFQKRVYLSLLNTKGGQSVVKDIQPDPRLHYFHRPENPRNVGYGYPKFIVLGKLTQEDSELVQNGAIFLRCRVYD